MKYVPSPETEVWRAARGLAVICFRCDDFAVVWDITQRGACGAHHQDLARLTTATPGRAEG